MAATATAVPRHKKTWIPEVPDVQIRELSRRIKPVIQFHGPKKSGLRFIGAVDPWSVAFTWSPEPRKRAYDLKPLCDITTYHSYAYHGFFKPSIAEVLAQIPAEYLGGVVAFEIVEHPETADDLNREKEALNAGYHVATTRLYTNAFAERHYYA